MLDQRKKAKRETALQVHIRWMIHRDFSEVLAIEKQCFEFPWDEDAFIRALRQRNCIGMVAEHKEQIVGFMIYELFPTKLHVLNFAVHEDWRFKSLEAMVAAPVGAVIDATGDAIRIGGLTEDELDLAENIKRFQESEK
jgi:hypothetical protein